MNCLSLVSVPSQPQVHLSLMRKSDCVRAAPRLFHDFEVRHAPRLRLDLSVNILTIHALVNHKIRIFGGKQLRPNLNIKDMVRAYLTFLAAAMGRQQLSLSQPADLATFVAHHDHELIAISLGAVFFGAMTYIGNGPNFMVKSIADAAKVKTPSFGEYFFRYALPILVPLFALVALLFFSPWRVF